MRVSCCWTVAVVSANDLFCSSATRAPASSRSACLRAAVSASSCSSSLQNAPRQRLRTDPATRQARARPPSRAHVGPVPRFVRMAAPPIPVATPARRCPFLARDVGRFHARARCQSRAQSQCRHLADRRARPRARVLEMQPRATAISPRRRPVLLCSASASSSSSSVSRPRSTRSSPSSCTFPCRPASMNLISPSALRNFKRSSNDSPSAVRERVSRG